MKKEGKNAINKMKREKLTTWKRLLHNKWEQGYSHTKIRHVNYESVSS